MFLNHNEVMLVNWRKAAVSLQGCWHSLRTLDGILLSGGRKIDPRQARTAVVGGQLRRYSGDQVKVTCAECGEISGSDAMVPGSLKVVWSCRPLLNNKSVIFSLVAHLSARHTSPAFCPRSQLTLELAPSTGCSPSLSPCTLRCKPPIATSPLTTTVCRNGTTYDPFGAPPATYWSGFEEISKYNVSLNYFERLWLAWYTYMQNDILATGIMSFTMHEVVYFGRSLPWIIIGMIPYFNKYKIQQVHSPLSGIPSLTN
jgi:hypothetical protein